MFVAPFSIFSALFRMTLSLDKYMIIVFRKICRIMTLMYITSLIRIIFVIIAIPFPVEFVGGSRINVLQFFFKVRS